MEKVKSSACKAVALSLPGFSINNQLPQGLVDHRVKEGQVMELDRPAENVLDEMAIEEKRAKLILKEAEPHETTHVPERIQSHLSWPGLSGTVKASLARLVEQRSCLWISGFSHLSSIIWFRR